MVFRKWLTDTRQKNRDWRAHSRLTASKMAIFVAPKTVLENKYAILTTFNSAVLGLLIILGLL